MKKNKEGTVIHTELAATSIKIFVLKCAEAEDDDDPNSTNVDGMNEYLMDFRHCHNTLCKTKDWNRLASFVTTYSNGKQTTITTRPSRQTVLISDTSKFHLQLQWYSKHNQLHGEQ